MKKYILPIFLSAASLIAAASPKEEILVFSDVVNPRVPMHMTFAGQKIDLSNIDMFERLDRELTAMTYTHGNTLLQIKRANRYFPLMAPILKKNGIPEDLLYLSCIESTLNTRAVSPAKAAGLWQFMPATGREYGLEVNDYVDERYDPERATEAACRYLKSAYNKFGNWENAAASYNCGQGRISKELTAQGVNSAYELWLPEETMRYVIRLLATKLIMENPGDYGFALEPDQLYQPIDYDIIEVNTPVSSWQEWAKEHNTTYYLLRQHNPWIRNTSLPNASGKVYKVRIPSQKSLERSHKHTKVYNKNWVE